jgi:uncharacterized protein (TIGR04255 family)
MRRQYDRPPIQEALCELKFEGATWAFGSPAALYERLQSEYPAEPVQVMASALRVSGDGGPSLQVEQQEPRTRFASADGQRLVVAGRDTISVHVLTAYPGWEAFRDAIERAIGVYREVAQPESVSRIGIRYINRIQIDQPTVDLEDYFVHPPNSPDELDLGIGSFFMRIDCTSPDEPIRLVQTFGSADSSPSVVAFILDLDTIREWIESPLAIAEALPAVDSLRDFERTAFESLITDKLRAVFDA